MKRKLWVILSLVLVLSIAFGSTALAANPNTQTFNFQLHLVTMKAACALLNGATYSGYQNSETFVMSCACYYRIIKNNVPTTYSTSQGGQNVYAISLAAYSVLADGDVFVPVYTQNKTIIGNAGQTFNQSIYAYWGS
jgi:hypothetical protein